jgi:hemerythrin-like domain-containing protein
MNVSEFQAALGLVEEDHQLVLEKVQALREAINCLLDPDDPDARAALDRLREMNDYFATRFEAHLEDEEKELFPLLEQAPGGRELVAGLRQEHEEIRRRRDELGKCLGIASAVEDELPRMVLRDLLAYGWELWDLLDRHAHAETQAVQSGLFRTFLTEGIPA